MTRFGLMMTFDPIREQVALAQWAEEAGFHAIWLGEGRLTGSAIPYLTLIAANTERIRVGAGVLPYRTRNVALLAATFKTLDKLAPSRISLGLGAWWEPLASRTGLQTSRPLQAMREILTTTRGLLAGETVTYSGDFVNVKDIRFDGDEDEGGRSYDVPIYIGAVGPRMLQLSGELADGVLLDFFVPTSYTRFAWDNIGLGARRSGRTLNNFQAPQLIATAVNDRDPQAAIDDCKAFLTQYIAQQPHIARYSGVDPGVAAVIQDIVQWPTTKSKVKTAMRHLSNDFVQSVCACGKAAEVVDRFAEYSDAGATELAITPMSTDKRETLSIVAQQIGRD